MSHEIEMRILNIQLDIEYYTSYKFGLYQFIIEQNRFVNHKSRLSSDQLTLLFKEINLVDSVIFKLKQSIGEWAYT